MKSVPTLEVQEFVQLRELIEGWCGIELADSKLYLVETRLRDVVMESGCPSYGDFFELASSAGSDVRDRIIDDMTTNETSWFRDSSFWRAFRDAVIPEVVERAREEGRSRLRVWSAACSTGQEAYSVALLLEEMARAGELCGRSAEAFEILATDVSRTAIRIAESARYDPISMRRGLSAELRDRHFSRDGRTHVLHEAIRKRVRYERLNLLDPIAHLGPFDIVLIRNVLIYFSRPCKQRILSRVSHTLTPGGALAVGATESPDVYSELFETVRHDRCTFYRPKERP